MSRAAGTWTWTREGMIDAVATSENDHYCRVTLIEIEASTEALQ